MADVLTIEAEKREKPGSASARRLRRSGRVPGVVYGHGEDSVAFSASADQVDAAIRGGSKIVDLKIDGDSQTALLKDAQWDTFGQELLHVDLLRVSKGEKVEVEIPIELHGIAPGVTNGGVLDHQLHALPVECPALQIPEKIEVNVNELEIGSVVHVSDLDVPDVVDVLVPPESIVVQINEAMEIPDEEEGDDLGPAEPEVIGRSADEGDGDGD